MQASRKIINVVTRDVSKAFDKVWHEGLRYKNINSYQFSSSAGVPQGSVLSPILYTLYTNDTPQPLNQKTLLMYADDITIHTNAHTTLQLNNLIRAELEHLNKYQAHWLIETNQINQPLSHISNTLIKSDNTGQL